MILLVVSSCVTNSELLNPHSFYLCISMGLSGPPPFFSSLTLTKTYCTRTCQPVHIIALCVVVTSSSDCTLSVYTTESVSHQAQSYLSTETHCPRKPPPPLPLLLHPPCQPASTGFKNSEMALPPKCCFFRHSLAIHKDPIYKWDAHLSTQNGTNATTADVGRIKRWLCSFMLFIYSSEWISHVFGPPCPHKEDKENTHISIVSSSLHVQRQNCVKT